MSVLDDLKEDFAPRAREMKSATVVLSDAGKSVEIYYRAQANVKQTDKYLPLMHQNKIEGYVELIIYRALNEDGTKMFKPKDKNDLMVNVDPGVLTDIGNIILGVDDASQETAEKERLEIAKKSG